MIRVVKPAMLVVLFFGMLATGLVAELGINRYPPTWHRPDGTWGTYAAADIRTCIGVRLLANLADASSAERWSDCARTFSTYGSLDGFGWLYTALVVSAATTLLAAFGFALALRFERTPDRIIRGRRLLSGRDAARAIQRVARSEAKRDGVGLDLVPGLPVSRERETRHWLIWGSVGGGKTQTMTHLILGAIERGDAALVVDVKGDMTRQLPGKPLLIAPQDARSLVWDIARDCRTRQDARELAARMIPDSNDPMWSDAAREIFVACVVSLQATHGDDWSWTSLYDLGNAPAETLASIAQQHHPAAVRLLQNPESRTTQSVLSTFQAHMHVVATLAEAWGDCSAERFSITEWLHDPPRGRPLILQHDPRYPALSSRWIGGMLTLLAAAVGSPQLAESRERRIWIFADEFPQLPRIETFKTFLDLGRSKGVIAVLAAQDLAQVRATYGKERTEAWLASIGTKIITRLNASASAREASELIGLQEIEREDRSESHTGGRSTVTTVRRRELRAVMTPSEIATRLGPREHHIDVLVLGIGADALVVEVPYLTLPDLRPGHVPAPWLARIGKAPALAEVPQTPSPLRLRPRLSRETADRIREAGE